MASAPLILPLCAKLKLSRWQCRHVVSVKSFGLRAWLLAIRQWNRIVPTHTPTHPVVRLFHTVFLAGNNELKPNATAKFKWQKPSLWGGLWVFRQAYETTCRTATTQESSKCFDNSFRERSCRPSLVTVSGADGWTPQRRSLSTSSNNRTHFLWLPGRLARWKNWNQQLVAKVISWYPVIHGLWQHK